MKQRGKILSFPGPAAIVKPEPTMTYQSRTEQALEFVFERIPSDAVLILSLLTVVGIVAFVAGRMAVLLNSWVATGF